jgi:hypothetical protein
MIMKLSIIKFCCSFLVILLLAGCKKDPDVTITETQVGDSKITFFVDLNLKGNQYMGVVKGQAFTDPGADATENGQPVEVKVSGTVNTAVSGIYKLTYTAVNKDGFAKSVNRYVGVLPEAPDPSVDLSGNYVSSTSPAATITKISDGLFFTSNCWGGGSVVVIGALFFCTDGTTLHLPLQDLGGQRVVAPDPGVYSNGTITWTISRLDFPGGLILEKVWTKVP